MHPAIQRISCTCHDAGRDDVRDEHEAYRALIRRRTREGLQLLVETIQSLQAEGTYEVTATLARNGVAVKADRIDPDAGRTRLWQQIREDSETVDM